jgi:hypothetical protein
LQIVATNDVTQAPRRPHWREPIVATTPGIDCCGCIIAAVEGVGVELRCNGAGNTAE